MSNRHQPKILLKPRDKDLLPITASSNKIVGKKNPTILTSGASAFSTIKERPTSTGSTSGNSIDYKHAPPAAALPDASMFNPTMSSSLTLIRNQNAFNYRVLDFLHETNQDYIVVGVIGAQAVGKSTVLNMLNQHLFTREPTKTSYTDNVFPVHDKINIFGDNEVKMFITEDRLVLLDYTEPMIGQIRKDFIQHEQDELKRMMLLLKICHVLLIVQEEYYNIRIMRSLVCAKMMSQNIDPMKFVFIRNKAVEHSSTGSDARTLMLQLYQRIFNDQHDASNDRQESISFVEIPILEKGCPLPPRVHVKSGFFFFRLFFFRCGACIVMNTCSEPSLVYAFVFLVVDRVLCFFLALYGLVVVHYYFCSPVRIAAFL
uniref:Protein SMG9 n=1 Tax=Anopheles darlingi TaxID=43151 RepID=A0A2M4CZK8_ANODA